MQKVHDLIDQAQEEFHRIRTSKPLQKEDGTSEESSRDRGEQFDSHVQTLKMVVDQTQANLENQGLAEPASPSSASQPSGGSL